MSVITIDYTPAYEQGGGIGRYVRDLVAALADIDEQQHYCLFVAGAAHSQLPQAPGCNFIWKPTKFSALWLARLWHRAHLPLPIETFTGAIDLYHATDFVLPPTHPNTRTLLTVHDLSFVRVPETASPNLKAYLDAVVPRSIKRATHVLADSQATKDDLVALYNTSPEKITVLLSGVDSRYKRVDDSQAQAAVREKYQLGSRPYSFSIGTVQPRKNYSRLIRALAQLRAEGHDLALVIAGGRGWLEDEMYQTLREVRMQDYVHLIGFADESDLPALYSGALCTTFPSLYEGFGLPVLESMACGTPVVTSNVSSLPEVAGNAALQVNPYDLEAITDAVRRIINDYALREDLIERGYQQARRFTWEDSARQLQVIYRDLLA